MTFDREAEEAVLGALLLDSAEAWAQVGEVLEADLFTSERRELAELDTSAAAGPDSRWTRSSSTARCATPGQTAPPASR